MLKTFCNFSNIRKLSNKGISSKVKEAIEVFKLNVQAFPDSWNVYDSLGEAYLVNGDTELAIKYYKKSLELNPDNNNAKATLKRLEKK